MIAKKELASSHAEISSKLKAGTKRRGGEQARADARFKRRAVVTSAADALIGQNPNVALCLYAEAIGLCAKGRSTKLLQSLRQKAGVARRRAAEEEGRRRKLRNRELSKKAHEKAVQRKAALSGAGCVPREEACAGSQEEKLWPKQIESSPERR